MKLDALDKLELPIHLDKLKGSIPRRSKIILSVALTVSVCLATIYLVFGSGLAEPTIAEVCNDHSPDCIISHRTLVNGTSNSTTLLHPKVLYYNTHGGAGENLEGVMSRLNVQLDFFNPKQITGYGMSGKRAKYLIRNGHVDFICGLYNVIVIGDTIPHGRAVMQSLLERDPAKRCKSKIIVEMTNRFDWDIKDKDAYYRMMRDLAYRSDKDLKGKIYFVANNNVEQAYMELKIGYRFPQSIRVLRPIGIAKDHEYPEDLQKQHFTHCIHVNILQKIAYANEVAGSSKRTINVVRDFPAWSGFMDYYDPLFAPYVYYFSSWEELREISMKQRVKDVDWKRVRVLGPLFYADYREKILEGWASLFHDMGFNVTVSK